MIEDIKTKARSRAGKLRLKRSRGRPKMEDVDREPNGRRSRAKNPKESADKLTIAMRAKHTGLSMDQAKDQRAATYIGRLYMLGHKDGLSIDQYTAAERFLEIRNDYLRSLLSPGAHYEDWGLKEGAAPEEYEEWTRCSKEHYAAALKAIQAAQFDNGHESLYAALQYVLIQDRELPYLLGSTRLLLNALHRHFAREKV